MTHLQTIHLPSGHSARSRPQDIAPAVLSAAGAWLRGVGPAPLPGLALQLAPRGRCLSATLTTADGAPVAVLGVAQHSRCGAGLWRALLAERQGLRGDPARPPSVPWSAWWPAGGVDLVAPEVAAALPGLLQALAWAWLDGQEGRRADRQAPDPVQNFSAAGVDPR